MAAMAGGDSYVLDVARIVKMCGCVHPCVPPCLTFVGFDVLPCPFFSKDLKRYANILRLLRLVRVARSSSRWQSSQTPASKGSPWSMSDQLRAPRVCQFSLAGLQEQTWDREVMGGLCGPCSREGLHLYVVYVAWCCMIFRWYRRDTVRIDNSTLALPANIIEVSSDLRNSTRD